MKSTILTTVAMLMAVSTLVTSAAEKRIPTLKVGKCAITLLDSNGIKPLDGAKLDLKQAENGETAVSAVANKSGLCEITVTEGRYILSIDDKPITLVNAAKDGELAWARIVVSESPMMVGGQEGATEATFTFMGLSGPAAVTAAVAAGVITVGAGGAIIYNVVDDDDDDDDQPPPPQPVQEEEDGYNAPPASL